MNDKPIYSTKEIEGAFKIARAAMDTIVKIMEQYNNNIGAEATRHAAYSFEQVMRASLRLDDSEGRGGRSPITNKGGQNG